MGKAEEGVPDQRTVAKMESGVRKRIWTPEEDDIVRATLHLPLATVASMLKGRTAEG